MFGPPGRGDRIARRIIVPLLIVFILVTAVFNVWFDQTFVDGDSMEPTLRHGDRVLVTKAYDTPRRGDVVLVLARPRGGGPEREFLKRVVAIEGDTIAVVRGVAIVNGAQEPGEYATLLSQDDITTREIKVPAGTVFTLGDNRPISYDSRFYGPAPIEAVLGRVIAIWAPIGRIGRVD
ncbi:MAG: signal peptidase I [Clostridiales bacterium]|nr:signal peptidase I [Clostridiales bacterium]